MNIKIQSLHMENFRCFTNNDIQLDENLTIFVGINGSGKTAILDCLAILLKSYARKFTSYPDANNIPISNIQHKKEFAQIRCTINNKKDLKNQNIEICKKIINTNTGSLYAEINDVHLFNLEKTQSDELNTIVVYYTSKRIINDNVKKDNISKSELKYAFANAFAPQIDFASSLAWFIERATQEALDAVQKKDINYKLDDLTAVRNALTKALGEYGEPFVSETPPELFIPLKNDPDQIFRIEELSDGYRTMLALVMDLARRMAVANKHIKFKDDETILNSPGIVLIDEIELHLHPSWQQTVLPSLMKIFPNVQFIVTTHSPHVLTSIEPEHIRLLCNNDVEYITSSTYGAESSRVLEEVLGVSPRPSKSKPKEILDKYFELINNDKYDSEDAKKCRSQLDEWLRQDHILDRADLLIQQKQRQKKRGMTNA